MHPANITRAEAQDRSTRISTQSYHVLVDLTGRDPEGNPLAEPEATFVSSSTVRFTSKGGHDTINIIADKIFSATLDGEQLPAEAFADYRVAFDAAEGEHELTVVALCRYSRSGEGLHRFVDPADGRVYLYTQFESADARRMYANFEQPDQKGTFTLSVIAPKGWTIISNGTCEAPVADGEYERWDFSETKPISTYITALVAGEYHRVDTVYTGRPATGERPDVPMAILCRQSQKEFLDAERIWQTTQRGFEIFEEHFGTPYPFGKYDQAFVPEFNAGAMENAGCVTHRDEYLFRSRQTEAAYESRDNTILHELAHMWFGDLVTMKWWDDLWLNESFAEFGSHFAQQKIAAKYDTGVDPWASFCSGRKNWAYSQDQLPTTHPIAADMVDLDAVEMNFDGITYAKGASTLRQLVAFVGEEKFLAALREYFRKHAYGNTNLDDLLIELTAASGRDLSHFQGTWLEQPGVNTLRADFDLDGENFSRFAVVQTATEQWPTLRAHRLAIGFYNLVGDKLERTDRIEVDIDGERTELSELVGKPRPALLLLNDDDLTYAKIRLDEQSLATLIEHMDKLESRLARALCWGAAWDMTRDGELDPGDYVRLVLRGVATEQNMTAVGAVLSNAAMALEQFVPASRRDEVRTEFTQGLAGLLRGAEPGTDAQLIFVRLLAHVANSDAATELFRGWLGGEEVPEGLTVDADLRWTLVTALARMGKADDALLAAEAEADQTITGQEKLAAAKTARPTAEAKEETWQRLTEDASIPNETARSMGVAFHQPGQEDVLAPFVERYLRLAEAISKKEGIWANRSSAISHGAVMYLFPKARTQEVADRVRAWRQSVELSDSVRRPVDEQIDHLERALRAQAKARQS